ncbi:hypothetical protein C8R46DRAFT_125673 [Mycena filopes]|nr:hypothetical protein C8R46DRAFT_125673 [Mycena filopes]
MARRCVCRVASHPDPQVQSDDDDDDDDDLDPRPTPLHSPSPPSTASTVLTAPVYVAAVAAGVGRARARTHLSIAREAWALERVFLGWRTTRGGSLLYTPEPPCACGTAHAAMQPLALLAAEDACLSPLPLSLSLSLDMRRFYPQDGSCAHLPQDLKMDVDTDFNVVGPAAPTKQHAPPCCIRSYPDITPLASAPEPRAVALLLLQLRTAVCKYETSACVEGKRCIGACGCRRCRGCVNIGHRRSLTSVRGLVPMLRDRWRRYGRRGGRTGGVDTVDTSPPASSSRVICSRTLRIHPRAPTATASLPAPAPRRRRAPVSSSPNAHFKSSHFQSSHRLGASPALRLPHYRQAALVHLSPDLTLALALALALAASTVPPLLFT